jgi:uncharacterized RDD family membrane protein YckC
MGSDHAANSGPRAHEPVDDTAPSPDEEERFVGAATRVVSWVLDAVAINLAAIAVGIGTELVLSIFPLAKNLKPLFAVIAGGAYIMWCALYFVAFWSMTGQTLGARLMQIRLETADRGRVRPARALLRWIGMNLAMLPLCAGYVPLLFKRRGFPDWLAHTLVLEAQQLSLAQARRATIRANLDGSRGQLSASSREAGPIRTR